MAEESKDFLLKLIFQAVNQTGSVITGLQNSLTNVETKLKSTSQAAGQMGNQLQNAAQRSAAAVQRLEQRLTAAGAALAGVGIAAAGLGAGLAAPTALAVKTASTFEAAMNRVRAVANATDQQFQELTETARTWGANSEFTNVRVAEGLQQLAMAGLSAKDAIQAIGPALQLAVVDKNLSLEQSADIMTNIMTPLQLGADQLKKVANTMAVVATSAPTTVAEIGEAMKYAAPAIASVGMRLEDASATIGVFAQNGVRASMAGTALRGLIASLSSPTKKMQEVFARLNVEIAKNEQGNVDVIETLRSLQEAGFTAADAFQAFERRSATAALALSSNIGLFDELRDKIDTDRDALDRMYQTMSAGLEKAVVRLRSALEGLLDSMGAPLLGALTKLVNGITWVVSNMQAFAQRFPTLSAGITIIVGVIGLVVAALGALAIAIGAASLAAGQLIKVWTFLLAAKRSGIGVVQAARQAILGEIATIRADTTAVNANTEANKRNVISRRNLRNASFSLGGIAPPTTAGGGPGPKPASLGGKVGRAAGVAGTAAAVAQISGIDFGTIGNKVIEITSVVGLATFAFQGLGSAIGGLGGLLGRITGGIKGLPAAFGRLAGPLAAARTGLAGIAAGVSAASVALYSFIAIGIGAGVRALYQLATDGIWLSDAWGAARDTIKEADEELAKLAARGFKPSDNIVPIKAEDLIDKSVTELTAERKKALDELTYYTQLSAKLKAENADQTDIDAASDKISKLRNNLQTLREEEYKKRGIADDFKKTGEAADDATESVDAFGNATERAGAKGKQSISEVHDAYAETRQELETYYDTIKKNEDLLLAKTRARITAETEDGARAKREILDAEIDATSQRIDTIQREHEARQQLASAEYKAATQAAKKIEDQAEKEKALAEAAKKYKEQMADAEKDYTQQLSSELQKQYQLRQKLAQQVKQLEQQIRAEEKSTAEAVRDVQITAASEYDRLSMKLDDAREKLRRATELMPKFPERATALAREARSQFSQLAQNVSDLERNLRSSEQLVDDALRSISQSDLTGADKWRADLQNVIELVRRARDEAAKGRTKEAEGLYKEAISQAQGLKAPKGVGKDTAKAEATALIQTAGKELIALNRESIDEARSLNEEVTAGIQQAGQAITAEFQRQIEATNTQIQAINANTTALENLRGAIQGGESPVGAPSGTAGGGTTTAPETAGTTQASTSPTLTAAELQGQQEALQAERERTGTTRPDQWSGGLPGTKADYLGIDRSVFDQPEEPVISPDVAGGVANALGGILGNLAERASAQYEAIKQTIGDIPKSAGGTGPEPKAETVTGTGTGGVGVASAGDVAQQQQGAFSEMRAMIQEFSRALDKATDIRVTVSPDGDLLA